MGSCGPGIVLENWYRGVSAAPWLGVGLGAGGAFSDAFSAALSRFTIGLSATGWCSQGCHGIVDTGTFLLTVPGQFMSAFLQALGVEESDYGVGGKDALHTRGADAVG